MKHHYRYFQRGEKLAWIPVPAEGAEREALANGAVRLTVLSTSKVLGGLESEATPRDLRFFGPFYADIDNKDNLKLAIESGNALVHRLTDEYGVHPADLQVFLSGSKGLHIFIDPACFGLERPVVRLPKVYMEMAKALYVSGMDLQVYSVRNAFRLPNVKRDDGRYRVQVTVDELRELTVERYKELVSAPRHDFTPPAPPKRLYTQLSVLFEAATEAARKADKPLDEKELIYAPQLRQTFKDELPPCVSALANGKYDETKNFNQVAMQVGIFIARMSPEGIGTFQPVIERMADNIKSSAYDSPRLRREHLEGQYHYMRANEKVSFSCNAMRSVQKGRVCDECPLEQTKVVETPEDAAKVVGLVVRADGYFDDTQKSPRRLSTFVLEPEHVYSQLLEDGQMRRVGTVASVRSNGAQVGQVMLDENSWTNRQAFLRALGGLSNLSYFGSETDLQKIKFVTMADADLPEKTMVQEMGLHITKVGDKELRTYAEKGKSINNLKVQDTFSFDGDLLYEPFLLSQTKVAENDPEARQALLDLLRLNDTEVMALLVGWAAGTHLKAHLNHLYRQFPPVCLWGNTETGKTTIAAYACILGGVDFITQHEVMNIPLSTPYSWLDSLSNSTSVPVIWDEVNKSGERMTAKAYAKACELLKATWNGQGANKGSLGTTTKGTGIVVKTYRLVRPVIYCAEQQPTLPALVNRSQTMLVTREGRKGRKGHMTSLRRNLDGLKRLAFTLMLAALRTPTSQVADRFEAIDKRMPEDLSERQLYGMTTVTLGLEWMRDVCQEVGLLDDELAAEMDKAQQALEARAARLLEEQQTQQVSSEVDRVFSDILEIIDHAVLAEADVPGMGQPLLRMGVNFMFQHAAGHSLMFLDVRSAHSAYLQHARRKGSQVILDDLKGFIRLALLEDYVDGLVKEDSILDGRHSLRIDIVKAAKRGLPVELMGAHARYVEF